MSPPSAFTHNEQAPAKAGKLALDLQSFQKRLSDRIQAAQAQTSPEQILLHVKLNGQSVLFALPDTAEVLEPSTVSCVPLTQSWYLGLTSVRGELTGVVDLAEWLGLGKTHISQSSRWVLLSPALACPCVLLVDAVVGLVNMQSASSEKQDKSPNLISQHLPWLNKCLMHTESANCWGDLYKFGNEQWACAFSLQLLSKNDFFLNPESKHSLV